MAGSRSTISVDLTSAGRRPAARRVGVPHDVSPGRAPDKCQGSLMSGQRIFISGGGRGGWEGAGAWPGEDLAECYARAGWSVCIGDLDVARCAEALTAIRQHAPRSYALPCDVTREADLQAAADWLQGNWQGVDVVVNNAGVAQMGGIDEATLAEWQWIVDINLLGLVRGCRGFAPLLRAHGGGRIGD